MKFITLLACVMLITQNALANTSSNKNQNTTNAPSIKLKERKLSLGGSFGYQALTGDMNQHYTNDAVFGLHLSYHFDPNFATEFGFATTAHDLSIPDGASTLEAKTRFNTLSFRGKYFLNSLTQYFGGFSPYFVAGFSQIFRKTTTSSSVLSGRDGALGLDVGLGFERQFNKNRNYIGFNLMYQNVDFPNEDSTVPSHSSPGTSTGTRLAGNIFYGTLNIGLNF